VFSGVSSVSTRIAEGPGDCGSGVFIAEEVDGIGDRVSGDNHNGRCRDTLAGTSVGLPDLGLFSVTAEVS
jgi:hypothetical protein